MIRSNEGPDLVMGSDYVTERNVSQRFLIRKREELIRIGVGGTALLAVVGTAIATDNQLLIAAYYGGLITAMVPSIISDISGSNSN